MGSWFPEERLDERCAATCVTGYAAVARLPAVTLLPYLQESSLGTSGSNVEINLEVKTVNSR